jgi:hypothetical protein
MNRMLRRPGGDGFPARLVQDMAAAAGVAVGHRAARPAVTTTPSRRRAQAVPRLLPRTVQLCVHCRHHSAGFWVSRTGARTVRRPWCLACCQELRRDRYAVIPFEGGASPSPPRTAARPAAEHGRGDPGYGGPAAP